MENPSFNVTLTEGEISVILCQLEEKVASYNDYENDSLETGTEKPHPRGKQTIIRM